MSKPNVLNRVLISSAVLASSLLFSSLSMASSDPIRCDLYHRNSNGKIIHHCEIIESESYASNGNRSFTYKDPKWRTDIQISVRNDDRIKLKMMSGKLGVTTESFGAFTALDDGREVFSSKISSNSSSVRGTHTLEVVCHRGYKSSPAPVVTKPTPVVTQPEQRTEDSSDYSSERKKGSRYGIEVTIEKGLRDTSLNRPANEDENIATPGYDNPHTAHIKVDITKKETDIEEKASESDESSNRKTYVPRDEEYDSGLLNYIKRRDAK